MLSSPCGIPRLNSNPDPGILGIYYIKQNHDFKVFFSPKKSRKFAKTSQDKNVRLIPSQKILGSQDFAKLQSHPKLKFLILNTKEV